MSVYRFPWAAVGHAIRVRQRPNKKWFASFPGDQWRDAFLTEDAEMAAVLAFVVDPDVRCGLPIMICDAHLTGNRRAPR